MSKMLKRSIVKTLVVPLCRLAVAATLDSGRWWLVRTKFCAIACALAGAKLQVLNTLVGKRCKIKNG